MIPYAQLKPGPGFNAAKAAAYYSQRLAIEPRTRAIVAKSIATYIDFRVPRERGHFSAKIDDHLATIRANGFVRLPDYPIELVDRLVKRLKAQQVVLPNKTSCHLEMRKADVASAAYPLETILSIPEVFSIASDATVLRIAQAYLGCRPTLSSVGIRWSFPTAGGKPDTQSFHRDMDDWRSVKFFIYLTDVTDDTGPHTYVRGSHRSISRLRAKPYGQIEIERRFGKEAAVSITGPRGTAFLADIYGIHRGAPPLSGPRLILQFQYSVLPVYAFHYAPKPVLPPAVDKYMFRLIAF